MLEGPEVYDFKLLDGIKILRRSDGQTINNIRIINNRFNCLTSPALQSRKRENKAIPRRFGRGGHDGDTVIDALRFIYDWMF